jgi:hypothetical protein
MLSNELHRAAFSSQACLKMEKKIQFLKNEFLYKNPR